ncbi:type III pantothenate kinase [Desulfitibacter alkalitolerans]|uniref:type III pantothenate kinase n=1 Tax=Desulfitibacter alkalitolerans TaxID=264641 RepID=UPI00048779E6|nr:type III pantothenate kinase [Desulfitibacter alkalitolerans]
MLFVIDIGNTNIVMGVYKGNNLEYYWRISTDTNKTSDELGVLLNQLFEYKGASLEDINAVVISSVVPTIMSAMEMMCEEYIKVKPLIIGPGIKTGLVIKFDNPKEVGADRIVNAVAAIEKYGAPAIVVDFGTATTFDAISPEKYYLGGAITPGIGISMDALFSRAAKLPRVELQKPDSVIGKSTVTCMQSGILYGYIGQVDGIVSRMKRELGGSPAAIATGGLAGFIAPHCDTIDHIDPYLTLEGLKIIYKRNL